LRNEQDGKEDRGILNGGGEPERGGGEIEETAVVFRRGYEKPKEKKKDTLAWAPMGKLRGKASEDSPESMKRKRSVKEGGIGGDIGLGCIVYSGLLNQRDCG